MKIHVSLNVKDIEKSVNFYSKMLNTEPAKFFVNGKSRNRNEENKEKEARETAPEKSGYAKFDIADPPLNLVLNETEYSTGGRLSHLGLQVETTDDVLSFRERWIDAGLVTADEMAVSCCYAKQDKTWVRDPDGNEWEAFVVLENIDPADEQTSCECGNKVSEEYIDSVKDKSAAACCDPEVESAASAIPSHETCCVAN